MPTEIELYNQTLEGEDRIIADHLHREIQKGLPDAESKIWHRHPVWFLKGNPIVGYSKLKNCVRLLFWSGQSFEEPGLQPEGKFKAAECRYRTVTEIDSEKLQHWLIKARNIQWDYKNIVKRKGQLERLV
ncbi:DUF1801 domain-containing protein [Litoribacter alkaliphilus]|uniref:DUF1801 domain-containing protein n=1 Tax=Litoribacter ruber TaxID=702568 RepID=A0AAP2G5S0_9BACT|nr:DUF1801 domain-containing protein [Litoribacter alkaliphilus]MBS9525815.1 DUF1801 domain-containing protein [Litoribacter alkaliphilus]